MVEKITFLLPIAAVISHVIFVILLLAIIFKNSWGKDITDWLGKYSVKLALVAALVGMSGSLFYSEIVGYEPCLLCWWQRVTLYPMVVLFTIALWKKTRSAFLYAVPLALISMVFSVYHSYVYMGGTSILPCTALGGACAKVYVMAFGYITIPLMAFRAFLLIILLQLKRRGAMK